MFYLNDRFNNFGMRVADQRSLKYITAAHLIDEAVSWGFDEWSAQDLVAETAESIRDALPKAPAEPSSAGVPDRIEQRAKEVVRTLSASTSSVSGAQRPVQRRSPTSAKEQSGVTEAESGQPFPR